MVVGGQRTAGPASRRIADRPDVARNRETARSQCRGTTPLAADPRSAPRADRNMAGDRTVPEHQRSTLQGHAAHRTAKRHSGPRCSSPLSGARRPAGHCRASAGERLGPPHRLDPVTCPASGGTHRRYPGPVSSQPQPASDLQHADLIDHFLAKTSPAAVRSRSAHALWA